MHSAPVLQNFQAVVALAADKRDIGLKHALKNGVHLVAFESAAGMRAGRIELRLAEGQDNIAQDLTRKLREWTGQNWVVSLSQEGGAATLGSVKQSVADRREEATLKDPFVQSALSGFPGAESRSVILSRTCRSMMARRPIWTAIRHALWQGQKLKIW